MLNNKRNSLFFILLVVCFVYQNIPAEDKGKMSVEERTKVMKLLTDSQKETLDALETLSDEQLNFKESPERWSVLEVAEHIMLSENLLFSRVEKALADKQNPEWEAKTKGKTEFLEKALLNRQGKAQAPEMLVPGGKISRADLIAKFKDSRARTLKFAQETELPLKAHTADHPFPIFGTLNAYNWLIYIPLHNMRHNLQIVDVRANAKFPKK
jgi:DinB superfamily